MRGAGATLVAFAVLFGMSMGSGWTVCARADSFDGMTKTQLEAEQLRWEIRKATEDTGTLAEIGRVVAPVTALVAVIGIFLTLWKQISETASQRSERSRQHELDREQRERELMRRFDEQFNEIVARLSSADPATRAAAAPQLATFLRPEYSQFHEQTFNLLLAALRFPRHDVSDSILSRTFEAALRQQLPRIRTRTTHASLDLSHCYVADIDLSRLDLSRGDVAAADLHNSDLTESTLIRLAGDHETNLEGAILRRANLQEARLQRANLRGVNCGGATLVSAKLDGVNARDASFRGARMQEAVLRGAALAGARFNGADLNNTFFQGATFNDVALRSIALGGALHWRKNTNFDAPVHARLVELADGE